MKRLFIGALVSTEFVFWYKLFTKIHDASGLRFTPISNLHITMYFIGEVDEKHLESISEIVKYISFKTSPFTLSVDRLRFIPDTTPRILTISYQMNKKWSRLVDDISNSIHKYLNKTPINTKHNNPHVTLARFKYRPNGEILSTRIPEAMSKLPISEIRIYQSHLSSTGSEYRTVYSYQLSVL